MTPLTLGADHDDNSLVDDLTYRFDGIHDRAVADTTDLLRDLDI